MGIFDIHIKKDEKQNKENLSKLEDEIKQNAKETILSKNILEAKNFKVKNSLLSYDLKIDLTNNSLVLEGELKEVLILTILVILSILFTYGVGVILVIAYTYYQKLNTSKYLEKTITILNN